MLTLTHLAAWHSPAGLLLTRQGACSGWPLLGVVALTALITGFLGLLFFNLKSAMRGRRRVVREMPATRSETFKRVLAEAVGPPLVGGNRITPLVNGDRFFPVMLEAIEGAQASITFESFIFLRGDIAAEFVRALAGRARAGVKVHVILDWVGSWRIRDEHVCMLEEAGVLLRAFHPPRLLRLSRLNERSHRKILVVDGRVAFTGGAGIADAWTGDAADAEHWRDTQYQIEGPVVAQMQRAFMENWLTVEEQALVSDTYFPRLEDCGALTAQVFTSLPTPGVASARLLFLLSIGAAREHIDITTPYFVPDPATRLALREAAERGVRVRILVPGDHIDSELTRRASRSCWGELLRAGATFFEYQPARLHDKRMVVDGCWTVLGSANVDNRSFGFNREVMLNVHDEGFASEALAQFERDLAEAEPYALEAWTSRSWWTRALDRLAGLVAPQL